MNIASNQTAERSRLRRGWAMMVVGGIDHDAVLRQIAFESVVQRQVRDIVRAHFPAESRLSQLDIDYDPNPIRVRAGSSPRNSIRKSIES